MGGVAALQMSSLLSRKESFSESGDEKPLDLANKGVPKVNE